MSTDNTQAQTQSGGARVLLCIDEDVSAEGDDLPDFEAHWSLRVVDHGWIVQPKHSIFIGPEAVIGRADIDSLREAMLDERRCCGTLPESPEWMAIALDNTGDFHPQSSPRDTVHFVIDLATIKACAEITVRREPEWTTSALHDLLTPAAAAHGCIVDDVAYLVDGAAPDSYLTDYGDPDDGFGDFVAEIRESRRRSPHEIRVLVRHDGPTTAQVLLAAGRDVQAMLEALKDGPLNARTAQNLLRAGLSHLLTGLPESEWLEVKSCAYGIATEGNAGTRQKIELAQDVARFADGSSDALLVVGFDETKGIRPAKLTQVSPIPLDQLDVDRYRDAIDARIVPPIEGLTIERVRLSSDHGILIIGVPRQPQELQPFLVHGAIAGDKVEGAFISIVRRRGEGSITTSAMQIHAYIVAGRAYLRAHETTRSTDDQSDHTANDGCDESDHQV